ncbi:MAG TPA: M14 family metallopeptidase [Vicinamibacterales bacterium]|nr:M14 family metallopeptidase [Vicinamibacterales bacterium]
MKFATVLLLTLTSIGHAAQGLAPGVTYDPAIPTLQSVVGHAPGEAISTPDEIGRYLEALAKAAPDRARLVRYATSWEGRPLHYLIVGSAERIARLDDVRRGMQALATGSAEAERLIAELPVIVWLIHGVHGNEISSADAALAEAYHLLAARDHADADLTRREALVIIDPMQNPDGRQRFVTHNLLGRAAEPDPEPASAEHDEPWPGGRSNHYLFDMNRDYFALTQPETQGRARVMLEWFPQVVVDLHEMGGNSTYYFAPPADPINPLVTEAQRTWFETFGRANAAEFDRRGFPYFIREVYDSFYPGYGESWPLFHGAIGMTYEQASARGLAFRRQDGTLLTYKDGVTRHFTAAITTAVTAARNRERLLRDFHQFRRSAIAQGQQGTREYVMLTGDDPSRAQRLARLLAAQGIQVRRTEEAFQIGGRSVPAGSFIVPLAQPAGRLVRNLLDSDVKMDEAFLKEQDRRRRERLPDQIYDVTAWSLPLAFDVEVLTSDRASTVRAAEVRPDSKATDSVPAPEGTLGFLLPWTSGTASAMVEAVREGLRVQTSDETFSHGGRAYGIGSAFVRLSENPEGTAARLREIAMRHDAPLVPITETWTQSGISLGSGRTARLKPPRVLLAWDTPVSSLSAGWARYVLERRFGQRVTAMRVPTLQNFDLHDYDVLVLPSGTYNFNEDALRRLRDWIRSGGTLVTLAEASRWAARDRVGLLSTDTLLRDGSPERDPPEGQGQGQTAPPPPPPPAKPDSEKPFDYDKAIQPERERPENLAGAMLRVRLDRNHWLSAGLDGEIQVVYEGAKVFAPLKLDVGRNVGLFDTLDRLVAAGLVWKEAQPLLAQRAYLMHQPLGQGHIVAFAEDPNYRGFTEATQLLFINAVLLGPAH